MNLQERHASILEDLFRSIERILDKGKKYISAEDREKIPGVIRGFREALDMGMSMSRFSRLMGVSLQTVWRWEHGKIIPNRTAVDRFYRLMRGERIPLSQTTKPCSDSMAFKPLMIITITVSIPQQPER